MKKIFKYEIPISDCWEITMPKGAKILTFQTQNEAPCIWVLVDPERSQEKRKFRVVGTGHEINEKDEKLEYIGTCQMMAGVLVWHLFEIKN